MKQMFKNISIFALSVCCGVFYSVDSQSKVCFLGDEDCTDNVSFDFNFIDVEEECKKEGYTIKAENCKTPYEYCPHSNMWVKCCNEQEYYYDSCDNNTTEKGRCGYGNNYKYKCECDESIYAFNNNSCSTRDPVKSVDTRYSCTEKDYNGNTTTLYAKCSCDGSYKYKAEDCEAFENSEPQNACTHDYSNGFPWGKDTTTYYAQCGCNRNIYKKDVDSCDLGAFGKICKDSLDPQKTYAENCKSCRTSYYTLYNYSLDNIEGLGAPTPCELSGAENVEDGYVGGTWEDTYEDTTGQCNYVECPYSTNNKTYRRIVRCNVENYVVNSNGTGCEEVPQKTCNEATEDFLKNVKYPGTNYSYPSLEGSANINQCAETTGEILACVVDTQISSMSSSTPVLIRNNIAFTSFTKAATKAYCTSPYELDGSCLAYNPQNYITGSKSSWCISSGKKCCNNWDIVYNNTEGPFCSNGICFKNFYSPYELAIYLLDKEAYKNNEYVQNMLTACAGEPNPTITAKRSRVDENRIGLMAADKYIYTYFNPLSSSRAVNLYGIDMQGDGYCKMDMNFIRGNFSGNVQGDCVIQINNEKIQHTSTFSSACGL